MFPNPVSSALSLPPFDLASDLTSLKQTIQGQLPGPGGILGSQLGGLVVKSAQSIGKSLFLKAHGGLKYFARTHLADIVTFQGKYKDTADDIYSVNSVAPPIARPSPANNYDPSSAKVTEDNYDRLWEAYSNPASKLLIEFDGEKNIYIRTRYPSPPPNSNQTFPSTTYEQYRQIVMDFANERLQGEARERALLLITTASQDTLHFGWYGYLRSHSLAATQDWGLYRAQKIALLFEQTAKTYQFPQELIDKYVFLLRKAQRKNKKAIGTQVLGALPITENESSHREPSPPSPTTQSASAGPVGISTDATSPANLRELVIEVVRRLSNEQLRQLDLPIGLVHDVIATPKF